jgi:hypothetical protein
MWGDEPTRMKHWSPEAHGDDPAARVVHPPTAEGVGTGKAFFFLFGYKRVSTTDQEMLALELAQIGDDVQNLQAIGYTVVVDPQGTRADFLAAVSGVGAGAEGLVPAGFYWSAHGGPDGSLECCDGSLIRPEDLAEVTVSPGLRLAVLGACYVGAHSRAWRRALGGEALVVGWGRPVTLQRAVDFLVPDPSTTTDLDDLLRRWLFTDTPLPAEPAPVEVPPPARAAGRVGALEQRAQVLAEMLHAPWHAEESYLCLHVPLPEQRSHAVEIFLLDSAEPFAEGEVLCGVEADIGEITELVTPATLLAGAGRPGFGRVALVTGETEQPRMVTQSFVSFAGATDRQLVAHIYQVAAHADALENAIFGMNSV